MGVALVRCLYLSQKSLYHPHQVNQDPIHQQVKIPADYSLQLERWEERFLHLVVLSSHPEVPSVYQKLLVIIQVSLLHLAVPSLR
jgi:hypothetical protein